MIFVIHEYHINDHRNEQYSTHYPTTGRSLRYKYWDPRYPETGSLQDLKDIIQPWNKWPKHNLENSSKNDASCLNLIEDRTDTLTKNFIKIYKHFSSLQQTLNNGYFIIKWSSGWQGGVEAWPARNLLFRGWPASLGKKFIKNPGSFFRFIKNPGSFFDSFRIRVHFFGSFRIPVHVFGSFRIPVHFFGPFNPGSLLQFSNIILSYRGNHRFYVPTRPMYSFISSTFHFYASTRP